MLPSEHRFHQRLRQYWDGLRKNRPFPKENEVNPDELGEIWDNCFLISIDEVTRRVGYRYSYLGTALMEAYGDDMSSTDAAERLLSTNHNHAPMVKKFDEVVQQEKPVMDESEFINLKQLNIRYRSCMLPLGSPEDGVTHILGCMRWKAY